MIKQTKISVDNVGRQTIGELNDYVKKIEQQRLVNLKSKGE